MNNRKSQQDKQESNYLMEELQHQFEKHGVEDSGQIVSLQIISDVGDAMKKAAEQLDGLTPDQKANAAFALAGWFKEFGNFCQVDKPTKARGILH